MSCDNKYVGAFLFSFALIMICNFELLLFTGKIGYCKNMKDINFFIKVLIGNIIGCLMLGIILHLCNNDITLISREILNCKLNKSTLRIYSDSFMCGILMYLAVNSYMVFKDSQKFIGIIFCITIFILSGFEHSIANISYLFISGMINIDLIFLILNCIIGNSLGALFISYLLDKSK